MTQQLSAFCSILAHHWLHVLS